MTARMSVAEAVRRQIPYHLALAGLAEAYEKAVADFLEVGFDPLDAHQLADLILLRVAAESGVRVDRE